MEVWMKMMLMEMMVVMVANTYQVPPQSPMLQVCVAFHPYNHSTWKVLLIIPVT
jgi:hypothetical protein